METPRNQTCNQANPKETLWQEQKVNLENGKRIRKSEKTTYFKKHRMENILERSE